MIDYSEYEDFEGTESGIVFNRTVIDFENLESYVKEYTHDGDIIIPLMNGLAPDQVFMTTDHDRDRVIDDSFMNEYDSRLLRVYRKDGSNISLLNPRSFGNGQIENKGIITTVLKCIGYADKLLSKIPNCLSELVVKSIQKKYDEAKRLPSGIIPEYHIWIPTWQVAPKDNTALLITLFGRINFIIS